MPKLRMHNLAMSLDGYVAGPDQSRGHPLGVGGLALHEWVFATRAGRRMLGEEADCPNSIISALPPLLYCRYGVARTRALGKAAMPDLAGRSIGSYELIGLVGRGGMGEVWRARHRRLAGREAAIKVLPAVLAADPDFLRRFEREANSAASLNHPHILPVWDYGEQDGVPYLVMPLVTGGTLKEQRLGHLSPRDFLPLFRQLADALDYAHSRGIVHRDVKPGNILFDEHERLYLADFGIAKAMQSSEPQLTGTGIGVGTPEYIAPEQVRGRAVSQSDIYALGIVVYEMLTGHVPYQGSTPVEVSIKHLTAVPPPLSARNPALPARVDEVVGRALAKEPADRHQTAGAFIGALEAVFEAVDVPTRPLVRPDRPADPVPPSGSPPREPGASATPVLGTARIPEVEQRRGPRGRMAAWIAGTLLLLGVGLIGGAVLALSRGADRNGGAGVATAGSATTSPTGQAGLAPGGVAAGTGRATLPATAGRSAEGFPFHFPVSSTLFEERHAQALAAAQRRVPDYLLAAFSVVCFDPVGGADCALEYQFYSRQRDLVYRHRLSLAGTAPTEEAEEPAQDDDERVVFIQRPWIKNPDWPRLIHETYATFLAGSAPDGFAVELGSNASALNNAWYDWVLTYRDNVTSAEAQFSMRGARIERSS